MRDLGSSGIGECKSETCWCREKDGVDSDDLNDERGLAVVGESFMSIDPSLSSASWLHWFVEKFNLLLVLVSFFVSPYPIADIAAGKLR